jgi:hypothetical protein
MARTDMAALSFQRTELSRRGGARPWRGEAVSEQVLCRIDPGSSATDSVKAKLCRGAAQA